MERFTGGTIHTIGGYVYHIFTEPGEYTLTKIVEGPVKVDVLIVAGGGGGGRGFPGAVQPHGGGGAGGVISVLGHVVEDANIPVEVGAGGAGGDGPAGVDSSDGDRSMVGDLIAFGGGRGGGQGGDGGSGGGSNFAAGVGGAGTEGQGHDGGFGTTNIPPYNSGGGGGAGAPGANGTSSESSGAGGDGIALESIGWGDLEALGLPTAVGGGGGGGVRANGSRIASLGGFGGGGNGGGISGTTPSNGEPGAPNTGGGGGAGANRNVAIATNGGDGGSGLVVIRYVDEPGPDPEGPWVPCPTPPDTNWTACPVPLPVGPVTAEKALDETGNGRDGDYEGEPEFRQPGLFPGSLYSVELDADAGIVLPFEAWMGAESVALEMWINLPNVVDQQVIARMGASPDGSWMLTVENGRLTLQHWHTISFGSTSVIIQSDTVLQPNTSYQVAMRVRQFLVSSPDRSIYLNGNSVGSSSGPGNSQGIVNQGHPFRVAEGVGRFSDVSLYIGDNNFSGTAFAAMVAAHYAARTDPEVDGESAYRTAVLADNPALYWRLHEAPGSGTWNPCEVPSKSGWSPSD